MNRFSSVVRRVFRVLLLLYPQDFRREWSVEMEDTFRDGEEAARNRERRFGLFRFWWRELTALLRTALRLQWALWVEGIGRDLRFGLRVLWRRPLFTAVSVGTLGLGIGSATAMFSVVNGVLLRPLPYASPHELVQAWQTFPRWRSTESLADSWDRVGLDWPSYARWRDRQTAFLSVAAYSARKINLTGMGDPAQISVGFGTVSLLPLLGVRTSMGRWFLQGEDGPDAAPAAVLGYACWQSRFGGRPDVLGMTLTLEGRTVEIVGVLPRDFTLRPVGDPANTPELWVPVGALGQSTERGDFDLQALGRLRPGATFPAAEPEAAVLFQGDGQLGEFGARMEWREGAERGSYRRPLLLLLGATVLLLLVACGNLATLLTGEVTNRRHEVAARTALGASRGQIIRQFLAESVILGVAGAVVGVFLSWMVTSALLGLAPPLPFGERVTVDLRVLFVAVGAGVGCGLLFGLGPAIGARWTSITEVFRGVSSGEGKKERAFQNLVIGSQMLLTTVLLVSCLLMARSLGNLLQVDPGFDTANLGEVKVQYPFSRYQDSGDRYRAIQGMFEAIAAIPGVESVTGTNSLPFSGTTINALPEVPGRTPRDGELRPTARRRQVLPGYFGTLGIPVLVGRAFLDEDEEGAPGVAVVNQAMAERYWPGRSPLGELLIHSDTFRVVGVVGDVLHGSLEDTPYPTFYLPLAQSYRTRPPFEMSFVMSAHRPILSLARPLREAVWSVDPDLPVLSITEASTLISRSAREEEFRTALMTLFGVLATGLAGGGVFGVAARRVARRKREMGICMALGAERSDLVRAAVRRAVAPGAVGLAGGLILSGLFSTSLAWLLFGVNPWDPLSYLGAALLLYGVMVAAAFLPARAATLVAPAEVLRHE